MVFDATESTPTDSISMELIFHGTGTSSGIPLIECVTGPSEGRTCQTCLASLTPSGRRNARRNTGAIIRAPRKGFSEGGDDGQDWVTVVVDVGKTFLASAIEWFPAHGLRKIDAVLITHAHADAMNGLDDLRGWTLRNAIQTHIDIYLTEVTFNEVNRSLPYLVSKEFASGGGDVPDFQWHIIKPNVPFEVGGITVLPFPVQHGRLFTTDTTPPAWTPTPTTSEIPNLFTHLMLDNTSRQLLSPPASPMQLVRPIPYMSLGFAFEDLICWISDVSFIPEDTWEVLEPRFLREKRFAVLVVDCLNIKPHTSHFGIRDSVATAAKFGADKTYLIGFGHEVTHDDWTQICEFVGNSDKYTAMNGTTPESVLEAMEEIEFDDLKRQLWMRPSYDGLKLYIRGRTASDV